MKNIRKPSAAETAILSILWEHQPCTVKELHEYLSSSKTVSHTTTLKQVQRMLEKGLVTRQPGEGRSHIYSAAEAESTTKSALFESFVKNAFGGSTSDLVMHALGNEKTSEAEIDAIKAFVANLSKDSQ